jgi:nucleotide-binding universal stress UspA family protein
MFQRILVPLDGSERAERAIPVAACLARIASGSITFLRVVTSPIEFAWQAMESSIGTQGALEADQTRAADYLAQVAGSHELAGVETKTQLLSGVPAEKILAVARPEQVDLIVLCSHGETGFKRWMLGSVAQQVTRHSPVPVLVLHERGGVPTNLHPEGLCPVRVLVALDGSSFAETVLAPAAYLSAVLSAPLQGALHLARVLPLSANEVATVRKQALSNATTYLQTVEQRLQEGDLAHLHLQVTSSVVVDTDVASTLIEIAEVDEEMEDIEGFKQCDVIAMATHGRSGVERLVMGSVTERILGTTKLPLLIVRPRKMGNLLEEPGKTSETTGKELERERWVGLF